jgi:hypothetical protein
MNAIHKVSGRSVYITSVFTPNNAPRDFGLSAGSQVAHCFVDGARPTAFPLTDLEVSVDASLLAWVQSPEWAYGVTFERWQALEAYAAKFLKETL